MVKVSIVINTNETFLTISTDLTAEKIRLIQTLDKSKLSLYKKDEISGVTREEFKISLNEKPSASAFGVTLPNAKGKIHFNVPVEKQNTHLTKALAAKIQDNLQKIETAVLTEYQRVKNINVEVVDNTKPVPNDETDSEVE